ncbi:MAG: hypothetical protein HOM25_17790 [Rhodospirillaceae bacterium]|nr:hypothetical protein [Rhodospirillaceae bacterium]MBT5665528.1 hypothetical protein [Rhodospirillaceae bacterium]
MIRRTFVFILEILAGLVAGGAILALVCVWWLSSGPVQLTFLTPYIERALSPEGGTLSVEIEDTRLVWAGWARAVDIRVKNVRLLDFEREELAVLPQVAVGLSLTALMRGIVAPTSLEIIAPKVTGIRTEDSHLIFGFSSNDPTQRSPETAMFSRLLTDLLGTPDPTRPFGYLKTVSIREADLAFEDRKFGNTWRAPSSDIEFRRDRSGIKVAGVLDLVLDGQKSRVDGSVVFNAETEDLDIELRFSGFEPGLVTRNSEIDLVRKLSAFNLSLSGEIGVLMNIDGLVKSVRLDLSSRLGEANGSLTFHPDGYNYTAAFDIVGVPVARLSEVMPEYANLAAFQADASGRIALDGAIDGRIGVIDFDLQVGEGVLDAPKTQESPIRFTGGRLSGRIEADLSRFQIREASLALDQGAVSVHVSGWRVGKDFDVRLDGVATDLTIETLRSVWPTVLGKDARDWTMENIATGNLEDARVGLVAHIENGDLAQIAVKSLNGSARISGATVAYFKPLPPLTNVMVDMTFTEALLDIAARRGQLGDLIVRDGAVNITGLDLEDQDIAIDLVVEGPVKTAVAILDQEPLGLIQKLGVGKSEILGDMAARLKFKFPLAHALRFTDVGLAAAANLRGVSLDTNLYGLRLSDADLNLQLTGQVMEITGTGALNGVAAKIKWREEFARPGGVRSRVDVAGRLSDEDRKALGLPETKYATGAVTAEIGYTSFVDGRGEVIVKGDLKEAELNAPLWGWRKPSDTPGNLYLFVKMQKDGGVVFEDVRLTTPKIQLKAGVTPNADFTGVRNVELRNFEYAGNQMQGTVRPLDGGGYDIRLSGRQIDISSFFDQLEDIGDLSKETPLPPLSIQAKFDSVLIGEGRRLGQVSAALRRTGAYWTRIGVDGGFGKNGRVRINYGPVRQGHALQISSNDAGQALSALGWSKRIKGGSMIIVGRQKKPGTPMKGRFRFGRFKAKEAPALARILQVLSLTGIFSALNQQGLDFETFEGEFDYFGGTLNFPRARAFGSDLGITIKGHVFLHNETVDMSGTVVPSYTVNQVIGNIPILGGLLTGGKDEGLFAANYKMSGSLEDPKVDVNPLSILAPGILRRLFSGETDPFEEPEFEASAE